MKAEVAQEKVRSVSHAGTCELSEMHGHPGAIVHVVDGDRASRRLELHGGNKALVAVFRQLDPPRMWRYRVPEDVKGEAGHAGTWVGSGLAWLLA